MLLARPGLGDRMEQDLLKFAAGEIDRAGRILVQNAHVDDVGDEWFEAANLVSEWRASHSGPLNTFQMNLRRRVENRGIVAQRLKRMPSIIAKLERLPRISLSQMQDIGGCRVVVGSPDEAFNLAADLAASRIRHELVRYKNYITHPRPSGYRGIHLVYSYNSDRSSRWQGLKIEMQVRSELQHQWATAVETVGTFIRDDLKSGIGDQNWLHFFRLMSAVIAKRENTPEVPNTPSDCRELVEMIEDCERTLRVSERLAAYQKLTRRLKDLRGISNDWVVIEFNLDTERLSGHAFKYNQLSNAKSLYLRKEMESRGNSCIDVVLVSATSLSELRRAYPNYFADLTQFRCVFDEIAKG